MCDLSVLLMKRLETVHAVLFSQVFGHLLERLKISDHLLILYLILLFLIPNLLKYSFLGYNNYIKHYISCY